MAATFTFLDNARSSYRSNSPSSAALHQHIRRHLLQRLRSESVGHAAGPHPGIAAGQHIDGRVANHQRLVRRDAGFLQEVRTPSGSGFFVVKLLPP